MLLPVLVCHLRFHQSLTHLEEKLGYRFKDRFLLQVIGSLSIFFNVSYKLIVIFSYASVRLSKSLACTKYYVFG